MFIQPFVMLGNYCVQIHGFKYLSIEDVQPSIQKKLNSLHAPWLLFIDDVWNERSIHQSPRPSDKLCKVVITSRFELHDLPAIRIKIDESSNTDIATRLLASKAANDPHQTRFPPGCEVISATSFCVVQHQWSR